MQVKEEPGEMPSKRSRSPDTPAANGLLIGADFFFKEANVKMVWQPLPCFLRMRHYMVIHTCSPSFSSYSLPPHQANEYRGDLCLKCITHFWNIYVDYWFASADVSTILLHLLFFFKPQLYFKIGLHCQGISTILSFLISSCFTRIQAALTLHGSAGA